MSRRARVGSTKARRKLAGVGCSCPDGGTTQIERPTASVLGGLVARKLRPSPFPRKCLSHPKRELHAHRLLRRCLRLAVSGPPAAQDPQAMGVQRNDTLTWSVELQPHFHPALPHATPGSDWLCPRPGRQSLSGLIVSIPNPGACFDCGPAPPPTCGELRLTDRLAQVNAVFSQ